MNKEIENEIEAMDRQLTKKAISTIMNKYQERLYNANKDIAEWLACRVSCRGCEPELLIPAAETLLKKAVIKYNEERDGDFEMFATLYVESRLVRFRDTPADLDCLLVEDECEEEFEKLGIN